MIKQSPVLEEETQALSQDPQVLPMQLEGSLCQASLWGPAVGGAKGATCFSRKHLALHTQSLGRHK